MRETTEIENVIISWEKFSFGGNGYAVLAAFDITFIMKFFEDPTFVEVLNASINELSRNI